MGVGAAASGVALGSGAGPALGVPATGEATTAATSPDRFGRMFPGLAQFAPENDRVTNALLDIGHFGGMLDAKDPIGRPPAELITDPAASVNNRDNPTHTAGTTFVGQFLDHDMTFDTSSRLGHATVPEQSPNARTPRFDLDSVYGRGPTLDPLLYDPADPAKLRVESGGLFEDLPRDTSGRAIVAEPRNDENLMIAGLHAAFLLFHNQVVDMVRASGTPAGAVFATARRTVTWHYQWIILHEFLPQIIGTDRVQAILTGGRTFYTAPMGAAFMPVEFQGAAYRFGHSMVRPSYRANLAGQNGNPFFGFVFDPNEEGKTDPGDLRGGARAKRRFIGWQTFFDFGDGQVKTNKRIDTHISTPLFRLPLGAIPTHDQPISLPQRNLLRHLTWQLPSGQAIATAVGVPVLGASAFPELRGYGVGLESSTPLWYYVLKEAEMVEDGLRLGPMGSRVVGEVMIGLLQLDPDSFLVVDPSWHPVLPSRTAGDFRMADLLTVAQVHPGGRGQ
jgi:hypothetical protein